MSTKTPMASRSERRRRTDEVLAQSRHAERRMRLLVWGAVLLTLAGIVAAMLLTSKPQSSSATRAAPGFVLTDTSGAEHTLASHRGENVLLYFNEGAGCQSCIVQMGEIEKRAEAFAAEDVTVLPIVMNTREQILADMELNGVTTPFLLDDGTVSDAYGTLGKGMHAGLPGHSFVLIDKDGRQRWYGEYPSMWLDPTELLDEVRDRLAT
jgi:peroxiredoxin